MGFQPRQPGETSRKIAGETQSAFGYIRRQAWTNVAAATTDTALNDQATSASVTTTATTFLAQPDFPRNVVITPGGTTTDVAAGDYIITGTNIRDEVITETIAIAANASTAQTGNKAFKTLTSILFPVQDGADATFDVGYGVKLGLDRKMSGNEVLLATVGGVYETTRPTVAASSSAIESNTISTNTAPDGSRDFVAVYVSTEKTGAVQTTA